ncbi:MAG: hypothetical protein K2X36_00565 [Microbacteriaceae bacterium]|nr:hypothetical protein [Microbacteriaceae bacterium]
MSKWLYAPNGLPIKRIAVYADTAVDIEIVNTEIRQCSFDDFPYFSEFGIGDEHHLFDDDDNEFMLRHCRWVEYDNEVFDPCDHAIYGWSDPIIEACARVARLSCGLKAIHDFRNWMPHNWLDTTGTVALDILLKGRIDGEIASLEEQIAIYRKGCVEVENLNELPGNETQVEEPSDA